MTDKDIYDSGKKISPSFSDELRAAGLMGLPFSYTSDGIFSFPVEVKRKGRIVQAAFPSDKRSEVVALVEAHNGESKLDELKREAIEAIEETASQVILSYMNNKPTTLVEYLMAEQDADQWVADGRPNGGPRSVESFRAAETVKGRNISASEAADQIRLRRDNWRNVLQTLREIRQLQKANVEVAQDEATVMSEKDSAINDLEQLRLK